MRRRPAAADTAPAGWGSPALRRATLTLAVTQLVSWGVLFYGFAVAAPAITASTGWAESTVAGAFALGLLVAGLSAPAVATQLARHDPRRVLVAGSLLGGAGMVAFAAATSVIALYLAWAVIGVAMAATLYEPAMAVLVAVDPARRHRTLAVVTVAGGLASTVFAPLAGLLIEGMGWRGAMASLGVGGAVLTAGLHAAVLPRASAHPTDRRAAPVAAPPPDRRLRRLRSALVFEQAAVVATTVHLVGLLDARAVSLTVATTALGLMGVGKVIGRVLLLGPAARWSLAGLAAAANLVQLAGLALPLAVTSGTVLLPAMVAVGAASGATTVLRPLLVVDLVGAAPFAAVNARLQRATTVVRAGAPLLLGAGVTAAGWGPTWALTLAAFAVAAQRYVGLIGRRVPAAG